MGWFRQRWVNIAWLDTLLKRLLTFTAVVLAAILVMLILAAVMSGDEDPSYRIRKRALWAILVFGVWIAIELVKLIVHPIRAAFSGAFLDEYAAKRAARAERAQANSSTAKRTAPGTTHTYKGEDPAAKGIPLEIRVNQVTAFYMQAKRWPDPAAPAPTDEYYYSRTLAELARESRSPEAPKKVQRAAKDITGFLGSEDWRQRYV